VCPRFGPTKMCRIIPIEERVDVSSSFNKVRPPRIRHAGHLRAIEKELVGIGTSASQHASASASTAGSQIAEAIGPILNDIVDRFGRGQRAAAGRAGSLGNEATKVGARVGNDALGSGCNSGQKRPSCRIRGGCWLRNFDWCCGSPQLINR
jgi:hypothetical protein